MMGIKNKAVGFTVIEMLIVIVVIAILATLLILSWTGIRQKAQVAVAQDDMHAVAQTAEVFRITYDRSPITASDFSTILQQSHVYDSTRTPAKSYAICADANGYAFVAWNPVVNGFKNGDVLYLYASSSGQQLYQLTNSSLSANDQIGKICTQVYSTAVFNAWTYNLP